MPLLFSDDNDDGLWAPYSPQVSMNFDSSKVTFAQKNFSDISAIGIVLSMHTPSKERLWFKMNVFSVALGSTYPTQVTFTQKSAIINHSLVQAVSPNKITLTTPVQGTVSLIDLKGRIAGKVNSFSPVSSFVLPKPVASGTYILQVKSGVVRTCQRISVK
jgi:hypothetical protein